MKIIVEISQNISKGEIIIKCREENSFVNKIKELASELETTKLVFYQENQEYYLNLEQILFFETNVNNISAHTINEVYIAKYKLYELEKILSNNFIRVSKSTIVNINHIFSVSRNITSSSLIEFNKSHKKIYVSRFYYKNFKEKLRERSIK